MDRHIYRIDESAFTKEQLETINEVREFCLKNMKREMYVTKHLNGVEQKESDENILSVIDRVIESLEDDFPEINKKNVYEIILKTNAFMTIAASAYNKKSLFSIDGTEEIPLEFIKKFNEKTSNSFVLQQYIAAVAIFRIRIVKLCEKIESLENYIKENDLFDRYELQLNKFL